MKTSSMIYTAAAVITLLAVLCGLTDLVKNRTKWHGIITDPPVVQPVIVTALPIPAVTSTPAATPAAVAAAQSSLYNAFTSPQANGYQYPMQMQQNPYGLQQQFGGGAGTNPFEDEYSGVV